MSEIDKNHFLKSTFSKNMKKYVNFDPLTTIEPFLYSRTFLKNSKRLNYVSLFTGQKVFAEKFSKTTRQKFTIETFDFFDFFFKNVLEYKNG